MARAAKLSGDAGRGKGPVPWNGGVNDGVVARVGLPTELSRLGIASVLQIFDRMVYITGFFRRINY